METGTGYIGAQEYSARTHRTIEQNYRAKKAYLIVCMEETENEKC